MGVYQRKDRNDEYWILYYDENGKRQREGCGHSKQHAKIVLEERRREVRLARQLPELAEAKRVAKVTFGDIAKDALAYCQRHAEPGRDRQKMDRMTEWWGDVSAASITASEIERRFASMTVRSYRGPNGSKKPITGATANRYRALLSLTFRIAQREKKVPPGFNPARQVELAKEAKRVRWLSAEEETRLRKVLAAEYPERVALLDLALNVGLRWSDQRDLVAEKRDGKNLSLVIGKTGVALGTNLNRIASDAFLELADRADSKGRLVREKSARGWFGNALRKAEISDFHWHDLRHTFATRLLMAGVPMQQVQKLLGHRSITMTQRYAHIVDGFASDALAKLAQMNGRIASGNATVMKIDGARKKSPRAMTLKARKVS
jgi:integrase